MINHKKTYEDVYSTDHFGNPARLKLELVSVVGMELNDYIGLFKSFLTDFYLSLFFNCVKLSWLRRKFSYNGNKTVLPMYRNSVFLNRVFVKMIRRNIGKDLQIITKQSFFSRIESYFCDFFPEFEEENPFENPDYYKFPYENISMDFLMVVSRLEDRLELLAEAEKQEMTYAVFMDYVINHVYSENERLGRDRYEVVQKSRDSSFYIKDMDKILTAKKGEKRI